MLLDLVQLFMVDRQLWDRAPLDVFPTRMVNWILSSDTLFVCLLVVFVVFNKWTRARARNCILSVIVTIRLLDRIDNNSLQCSRDNCLFSLPRVRVWIWRSDQQCYHRLIVVSCKTHQALMGLSRVGGTFELESHRGAKSVMLELTTQDLCSE